MNVRQTSHLRLATDVPDLDALGATSADDLLADPPRLATADRARPVGRALRLPLPGTPDESGRQHEAPRGAGTGYLYLHRHPAGGLESWRARLTHPRSTSLAARHWNLICHLQSHGLATPQLVALVERRPAAVGAESVLITRELEGFVALRAWLADVRARGARRRGLRSVALALAQLVRCGAWLPRTTLANLQIQSEDSEDCAALQITNLRSQQGLWRDRGLVRAGLPTVAFTQFERGRIVSASSRRRRAQLLKALADEAGALLSRRERLELVLGITGEGAAAREVARECR